MPQASRQEVRCPFDFEQLLNLIRVASKAAVTQREAHGVLSASARILKVR